MHIRNMNKQNNRTNQTKQKHVDTGNRTVATRGEVGVGRVKGIKRVNFLETKFSVVSTL